MKDMLVVLDLLEAKALKVTSAEQPLNTNTVPISQVLIQLAVK